MQTDKERFKVAAYYYEKAAEVGLDNAGRLVQFYTDVEGDWQDGFNSTMMTGEVGFHPAYTWRIKPETVMHKGGEYPKPISICDGEKCPDIFYIPMVHADGVLFQICRPSVMPEYQKNPFCSPAYCFQLIKAGIAHETKEAAIAHAKVIYQIED